MAFNPSNRNPHLFPPHAFRGAGVTFWEMPEVRHGFGAGRHPVRPASAHGEQPVAPRHHGRRHGRDHGSADDDDAVTAFKHCQTFGIVVEEFR